MNTFSRLYDPSKISKSETIYWPSMKLREEITLMPVVAEKLHQEKTSQHQKICLELIKLSTVRRWCKNAKIANFYWQFPSVLTVILPRS